MRKVKKVLKKRDGDLSVLRFQERFPDEEACRNYLFKLKWPQGFICSKCGHNQYYFVKRLKLYQCKQCNKQHSVTSETILHKTHVSLQKWFWAIYWVARDKRGLSALALKNLIHVSYPTAWLMMQKIRTAMSNKDKDYILSGLVVVDDAYFGGPDNDKKSGRGTEKAKVVVAISLNKDGSPLFAKMEVVKDLKLETLAQLFPGIIKTGSTLRSDSYASLKGLKGYLHDTIVATKEQERAKVVLKWVNTIISNAKAYILGTYHGLPDKHLAKYLHEYVYRFNRRFCESQIFGKLVNACVSSGQITYAELTL